MSRLGPGTTFETTDCYAASLYISGEAKAREHNYQHSIDTFIVQPEWQQVQTSDGHAEEISYQCAHTADSADGSDNDKWCAKYA
jgi:hypothetical protein